MNGWLILDKPLHVTSARAVDRVKRLIPRGTKIGHAGTLDPLASGVLPIALGEATKTIQFGMDKRKAYRFEVTWGEERSTDDAEGEVVKSSEQRPDADAIDQLLPQFIGKIQQLPPDYSAIKLNGKRAYDLARSGEEVVLQPREIEVFTFSHHPDLVPGSGAAGESSPLRSRSRHKAGMTEEETTFTVTCGKGTYVRSLARDMGRALGCFGYVSAPRRTAVGKFDETHAISLEMLENLVHKNDLTWLHPVESMLDDIPAWGISPPEAARLRAGQFVSVPDECANEMAIAMLNGSAVAICRFADGRMLPVRVFNMSK